MVTAKRPAAQPVDAAPPIDEFITKLPTLGGPNVGTLKVMTAAVRAEQKAREEADDAQRTKL